MRKVLSGKLEVHLKATKGLVGPRYSGCRTRLSPKLKDIRRNGACIRIRCVPHGVGDLDGVPIVFEGVNLERHPHSSTVPSAVRMD